MRHTATTSQRPLTDGEALGRGELVRVLWRLARTHATGVLSVQQVDPSRRTAVELLILRRGVLVTGDVDGRQTAARLARLTGLDKVVAAFDGGVLAYPPGAGARQFSLAAWVRHHLESQLDSTRAQRMFGELAGTRLAVRSELTPDPAQCDETDRRILTAMAQPRRLDQIWPLAHAPRFRLLTFIHFLRSIGALTLIGVAAPAPEPRLLEADAHRTLGVSPEADRETVKRAYRRLARALHPDLHGDSSAERRRVLERRLAEVTSAYRALTAAP